MAVKKTMKKVKSDARNIIDAMFFLNKQNRDYYFRMRLIDSSYGFDMMNLNKTFEQAMDWFKLGFLGFIILAATGNTQHAPGATAFCMLIGLFLIFSRPKTTLKYMGDKGGKNGSQEKS